MAIVPRSVQHSGDDHSALGFTDLVDDSIWKPLRVAPPDVLARVTARVQERILGQRMSDLNNLLYELPSQTGLPGFVPRRSFSHVAFYFGAELNGPAHLPNRERSRVSISLRGTPDLGPRR